MGVLSGDTWGSALGGGEPGPNYREEIPDWFFDHCYSVIKIKGYPDEEEISLYMPVKQQELRNRANYPVGSILCYCSKDGYPDDEHWIEEITAETWVRWQEILIAPPHFKPQRGHMGENYANSYVCEWWLRTQREYPHNLRTEVQDVRNNANLFGD